MTENEEWRPVAGWPYEVSSSGRVRRSGRAKGAFANGRSSVRQHEVYGRGGKTPYLRVSLREAPRYWTVMVHALVATAFHGPRPTPKHQCNHIDGNKANNTPANLEWVTATENIRHAIRTGLTVPAPRNIKLSLSDRVAIRRRHVAGGWISELAKEFGVDSSTIALLVKGKTWADENSVVRSGPRTHCKRGHEYTLENTRLVNRGRCCITCKRKGDRLYRAKRA